MSTAISGRFPPVVIVYTCRGKRVSKRFDNPYVAKRFYAAKLKDGKNPEVKAVSRY